MSNWTNFYLDVLAASPDEIQQIEGALQEPSKKLLDWEAGQWKEDIAHALRSARLPAMGSRSRGRIQSTISRFRLAAESQLLMSGLALKQ